MSARIALDVSAINAVSYDTTTRIMSTGPGTQLQHAVAVAKPNNVFFGWGDCPDVTLGGYLQGGGQSEYSTLAGYAVDAVVQYDIVLASGEYVSANATDYTDLYWSLRGGGGPGGNFGVVVGFHIQTKPAPTTPFLFATITTTTASAGLQLALATIAAYKNATMMAHGFPEFAFNADGSAVLAVAWVNSDLVLGRRMVNEMFASVPTATIAYQTQTIFENTADNFQVWGSLDRYYAYLVEGYVDLDTEQWPQIFKELQIAAGSTPHNATMAFVGFFSIGGAAAAVAPNATAFVHRTLNPEITLWMMTEDDDVAGWTKWTENTRQELLPYFNGMHYQNMADYQNKNWQQGYYGENYARLVNVKKKYDPSNFFQFPQSIGSQ